MATKKTLRQVVSGASDASIRFDDLCSLLESVGVARRTKGSHHIFRKAGVENAKPHQVKQVRAVILKYKLG